MRVIISAGGTGGHIYPALAIIHKIKEKEPNSEFLYIGTHNRMEKDIIPKQGIPFKSIEIYGFNRKKPLKNIKTVQTFWKSYQTCKKIIQEFKPDIVIGVGGYVTGPVLYAAHKLKIKTFIHEQNSVPGKCNRFLSRFVDRIAISFASTQEHFPASKTIFTGNPCSEEAMKALPVKKEDFGLTADKPLIYIVMGSLGANKVTEVLVKNMSLFNNKPYEVLFVTGHEPYEEIKNHKFPSNVKVVPYVENQTRIMKRATIIVSRCGASTLSEIIALELPSILIPSPYVPDNHQYKNARDLVSQDAAVLIEEKDLKGDILVRTIDRLLKDHHHLEMMRQNIKQFQVPNSATKIYTEIKNLIEGK